MLNKVQLVGRLTKDPELKYLGNGTPVTNFTLAVNRTFKNKNGEREADFINIVVWRKQAENVAQYVEKGSQVAISGRIQSRSYENADGQRRCVTEVVAEEVHFLDSKRKKENYTDEHGNSFQDLYPLDGGEDDLPF